MQPLTSAPTKPAPAIVRGRRQSGMSLIIVLLLLVIVSILGVGGMQIASMSERSSRNDRDMQIAWQAAEAALIDAEVDIYGPGASDRRSIFTDMRNVNSFVTDCGSSGNSLGLCQLVTTGKPAWLTVEFDVASSPKAAELGSFTHRTFPTGTAGVQPRRLPRYVIEPIRDPLDRDRSSADPAYVYRVTAMGFGPRDDIQAVAQMLFRK